MSSKFFFPALCAIALTSTSQANLVVNGDFELGDTGFSSDYANGDIYDPSIYLVGTNPGAVHTSWASYGDHTSGAGNMMIINGSEDMNDRVWYQTGIAIAQNTTYYFSTWIASSFATNLAELTFLINGDVVGNPIVASSTLGEWVLFYAEWGSGTNTVADLAIRNAQDAFDGNDFALDDIAFGETVPVPEPATLTLLTFAAAAGIRRRRRS